MRKDSCDRGLLALFLVAGLFLFGSPVFAATDLDSGKTNVKPPAALDPASTIKKVSKMNSKALAMVSKMNSRTLGAVTKLSKGGVLNTLSRTAPALAAAKTQTKNQAMTLTGKQISKDKDNAK